MTARDVGPPGEPGEPGAAGLPGPAGPPAPSPGSAVPAPVLLDDPFDRRVARRAEGLLRAFNLADVLDAADVHVARRLGRVVGEDDERVLLAVALTVRAVRQGSVCLDLTTAADGLPVEGLDWPEPAAWRAAVAASPLVAVTPASLVGVLHLEGDLLYLDRYWAEERQVVRDLTLRTNAPPPTVDEVQLEAALARAFPVSPSGPDYDEQRAAAEIASRHWTSVVTGGPGTGKTTTIARFLSTVLAVDGADARMALAAPTGKAAARMTEALRAATDRDDFPAEHRERVGELSATTMHRLLGWRPGSRTRFLHDRGNPLPHDVVVIDETSMVSLTLMARLLEAMRPGARLVLVGDADQLASVDAGAVLTDLVEGLGDDSPVVARLGTNRRYGTTIGTLASAVRVGDVEAVLAAVEVDDTVTLVPEGGADALVRAAAVALLEAASSGDPVQAVRRLDDHRLLCAHRAGAHGVRHWNRRVERWLTEHLRVDVLPGWYAGQPLLVTANDYGLELFNGDTGVVVSRADDDPSAASGAALVARMTQGSPETSRELALTRLAEVETAHAMTVHRSQGSQFRAVTVVLPTVASPLLTRQMLYTAVTRAQERVVVVGTPEALAAAVARPARRASGLAQRLRRPTGPGD